MLKGFDGPVPLDQAIATFNRANMQNRELTDPSFCIMMNDLYSPIDMNRLT